MKNCMPVFASAILMSKKYWFVENFDISTDVSLRLKNTCTVRPSFTHRLELSQSSCLADMRHWRLVKLLGCLTSQVIWPIKLSVCWGVCRTVRHPNHECRFDSLVFLCHYSVQFYRAACFWYTFCCDGAVSKEYRIDPKSTCLACTPRNINNSPKRGRTFLS